ncbi:MAG: acylphosphatase [Bacteroidales bacterium]|nr:acylphosphatase [Bacteroidales bacterium]HRX32084.1 acylphosphatase [Tenuifilaceae bacterium]
MNKKIISITINGRVQGVGFRYFVYKTANAFGVYGFVKNLNNGDVYIEACAEDQVLQNFVLTVQKGSFYSKVNSVTIKPLSQNILPTEFHIL